MVRNNDEPPEPKVTLPPDIIGHGYYLNLDQKSRHRCRPPGWLSARLDGVRDGAEWRCLTCSHVFQWKNGHWRPWNFVEI